MNDLKTNPIGSVLTVLTVAAGAAIWIWCFMQPIACVTGPCG